MKSLISDLSAQWGGSFVINVTPIDTCSFDFSNVTARDLREQLKVMFSADGEEDNKSNTPDDTSIKGVCLCIDKTLGGLYILAVCRNFDTATMEIPILNDRFTLKYEPEFQNWQEECRNWYYNKSLFERIQNWHK